jgi:hypothetical protein
VDEAREFVGRNITHVYGPEEVSYAPDELVVVCLVRNGRPYLETFMDHYSALGVRHVVFLDNGSDDGTVEAAQGYENVTVLATDLPYRDYKYVMKQYLIHRFGRERWCLYVDIDELFDYPRSDVVGLSSFLEYLNRGSFTTVVAQMLDMFPEGPLAAESGAEGGSLREQHRFYDISDIDTSRYRRSSKISGNTVSNDDIRVFYGGIRKTLFDVRANLTKHPLIFVDDEVRPMDNSSHRTNNARVADLSCVLYHYKFLENFREHTERAIREGSYFDGSAEYKKYRTVLDRTPELRIKQPTSRELTSVNELVAQGFLVISEEYADWADAEEDRLVARYAQQSPERLADLFFRRRSEARLSGQRSLNDSHLATADRYVTLREQNRHLRERKQDLERQLQSIRESSTWKLASLPARLKGRLLKPGKR